MSYTEPKRPCEGVIYEEPAISREVVTIPSGTAAFAAMMVLGRTLISGSAAAVGFASNTGSVGAVGTIAVDASAKPGVHQIVIVEPGSNVGTFIHLDPDHLIVGKGEVATEYTGGGLTFTIADATDYKAGDGYQITVTGTAKYLPYDDANSDGSNVARAIALYPCDASGGEATVTALVREAAVDLNQLSWHASADATAKTKAVADLAKALILVRS